MDNCELKSISFTTTVTVINVNSSKNIMITTRTERAPRLYTVSVNKISHEVAFAWRELMRRKAALYVRNPPTLAEEQ